MNTSIEHADNPARVIDFIKSHPVVMPCGRQTKSALSSTSNLSVKNMVGITEYDPGEYTISAHAGTLVTDINHSLQEHNQYLPFDPPTFNGHSTLGGMVASGLSGSGRFRFGGIRDFLIAVTMVTGDGELIRGGAPVVKNAAGFDLPKLMVGSCGRLGVMTQVTFKVFPAPETSATLMTACEDIPQSRELMAQLGSSIFDIQCLDLDDRLRLWIRLRGFRTAIAEQIRRVEQLIRKPCTLLRGEEEQAIWQDVRAFRWISRACRLVKVAMSPRAIPSFMENFADIGFRMICGGHMAWLAWPNDRPWDELESMLAHAQLSGMPITGDAPPRWSFSQNDFFLRLKSALDPQNRFGGGHAA